jgi:hypothetical protein
MSPIGSNDVVSKASVIVTVGAKGRAQPNGRAIVWSRKDGSVIARVNAACKHTSIEHGMTGDGNVSLRRENSRHEAARSSDRDGPRFIASITNS